MLFLSRDLEVPRNYTSSLVALVYNNTNDNNNNNMCVNIFLYLVGVRHISFGITSLELLNPGNFFTRIS